MAKLGGLAHFIAVVFLAVKRRWEKITEAKKELRFVFFCDESRELDKGP